MGLEFPKGGCSIPSRINSGSGTAARLFTNNHKRSWGWPAGFDDQHPVSGGDTEPLISCYRLAHKKTPSRDYSLRRRECGMWKT